MLQDACPKSLESRTLKALASILGGAGLGVSYDHDIDAIGNIKFIPGSMLSAHSEVLGFCSL